MRSSAYFAGCVLACLLSPGAAVAAPPAVAGPVCGSSPEVCLKFSFLGGLPAIILKQVFTAPSAGTVVVSVHGSMQCVNSTGAIGQEYGVIDVSAQIVPNNGAADGAGPGGQRISMRIPPTPPSAFSFSNAVAIASARVMPVARGSNTFRYKMVANRLDYGVQCTVFSAQMIVMDFTP